jgi:hypothetical protein
MHSNKLHFEVNIIGIINQNFKKKLRIFLKKKLLLRKEIAKLLKAQNWGGEQKTPLSINNMTNFRIEKQKKRKTHNF